VNARTKFYSFLIDPDLGGLGDASWRMWHVVARLLDGDAHVLSADDLALAQQITGRTRFPREPMGDFYGGISRRAGKTRVVAALAAHAVSQDYALQLAPGETAIAACIAPDRKSAGVLFSYCRALARNSPFLAPLLVRETTDTLEFANSCAIEVHTASLRTTRGRTFCLVAIDEGAFLPTTETAAEPDIEIARAVRPGLATLGGRLCIISSPYMKVGLLHQAYQKHYANDDSSTLYVTGASIVFNPSLDRSLIAQAIADDPEAARAEWQGQFRDDLTQAFLAEWIDRACSAGIAQRPRALVNGAPAAYVGFTDPSGGGGRDSWASYVVHREADRLVADACLELRPPFNTAEAAKTVAEFFVGYGLHHVVGDRYAGLWPTNALAAHGLAYSPSELDKSALYKEGVSYFSAGRVDLIDHARTFMQLRMVQRRARPGGRDSFDAPGGAPDDCSNALVGALYLAERRGSAPGVIEVGRSEIFEEGPGGSFYNGGASWADPDPLDLGGPRHRY